MFIYDERKLKFHKIYRFCLMLGVIGSMSAVGTASILKNQYYSGRERFLLDILMNSVIMVLYFFGAYGAKKRKKYAWDCIIAISSLQIISVFLRTWLLYFEGIGLAEIIPKGIGIIIAQTSIFIYYYRRKPLFYPEMMKDSIVIKNQEKVMGAEKKTGNIKTNSDNYCFKCGSRLIGGSAFCSNCGAKVNDSIPNICKVCGNELPEEVEFCHFCGAKTGNVQKSISSESMSKMNGKKNSSTYTIMGLLTILCVLLCVGNIYQLVHNQGKFQVVQELQEENDRNKSLIEEKQKQIDERDEELHSIRWKVYKYDQLLETLSKKTLGYSSDSFKTKESVVVVKRNERSKKITLTARNCETCWLSVLDEDIASVTFDQESWWDTTTLTVVPKKSGWTTAGIWNGTTEEWVDVLIIVED